MQLNKCLPVLQKSADVTPGSITGKSSIMIGWLLHIELYYYGFYIRREMQWNKCIIVSQESADVVSSIMIDWPRGCYPLSNTTMESMFYIKPEALICTTTNSLYAILC